MKQTIKASSTDMVNEFEKTAIRVSALTIGVNVLLAAFKLVAGIVARSGAMISDGVHSASDVMSTVVVIIGVRIAAKESDKHHPYGHERMECVAAVVLAVILLISGLFIGYSAVQILVGGQAQEVTVPGALALAAAVVSIVVKEGMYWYTRLYALRLDSGALMADAWHHRSDALSSVGALIGIAGARMGFPWMDSIASLVICLFIVKAAYDIFKDAINKMVDHSCNEDTEQQIVQCAVQQDGVDEVSFIQTRMFGNKIYVEIGVCADGRLTLAQSHDIAVRVHDALEDRFEKIKHITVCMSPSQDGATAEDTE